MSSFSWIPCRASLHCPHAHVLHWQLVCVLQIGLAVSCSTMQSLETAHWHCKYQVLIPSDKIPPEPPGQTVLVLSAFPQITIPVIFLTLRWTRSSVVMSAWHWVQHSRGSTPSLALMVLIRGEGSPASTCRHRTGSGSPGHRRCPVVSLCFLLLITLLQGQQLKTVFSSFLSPFT